MAEFIKTAEVIGRGLKAIHDVGAFTVGIVKEAALGGGWTKIAGETLLGRPPEATTPKPANVTIYRSEEDGEF